MKMPKTTPWVAAAALGAAVILVLAWVVGIGPQLDSATQARDDAAAARAQNLVHAQRLAELEEQFENLDDYKAELAAIRVQIPMEDGEPAFIREVQAGVQAAAVFLISISSDVPEVVAPQQAVAPAPVPVDPAGSEPATGEATQDAAAADGTATAAPTPQAPTPVASIPGFVAVPFTITVLGPLPNGLQFIDLAQTAFQRLFVVTQVTLTGQAPSAATGGKPEIREGDYETAVSGYVFVLEETTQVAADPAADPAAGEVVDS